MFPVNIIQATIFSNFLHINVFGKTITSLKTDFKKLIIALISLLTLTPSCMSFKALQTAKTEVSQVNADLLNGFLTRELLRF